jgi:rhodanese-related sulfurtransferase
MSVDALLADARRSLRRLTPSEAHDAVGSGAVLVDIRPLEQRERDGVIPGARVIDRNVLEWRLDPRCPFKEASISDQQRVVIICNEGYSSSLAAATLRLLGRDATDVIGGFQNWLSCGLPIERWERPRIVPRGAQTLRTMASGSVPSSARGRHWDSRYMTAGATQVSWYQPTAGMSLALIDRLGVPKAAPIIDIGGGASLLVDELLARDYTDLTVLDVSVSALSIARQRLGNRAPVRWLCEDVTTWQPERRYGLWHDRAVFHFLTEPDERVQYMHSLHQAIGPAGAVIMATFASDGPESCSGLPVARYDAGELERLLDGFSLIASSREEHITPEGIVQPFTWIGARWRSAQDLA